jgi:UDP-N-acetylmuramoyl-tripeptide--D-alanyl-D-alanine ligase
MISIFFSLCILALGTRTLLWHLQNWQIREYNWKRMRARLRTKEGKQDLYNLWFFRGILPRPKFSARIILIITLAVVFSVLDLFFYTKELSGLYWTLEKQMSHHYLLPVTLLIWERFIWLYVAIGVWLTKFIANYKKKKLFRAAKNVIDQSDQNIIRIAITGSYGKSSTKEILVHLLQNHFGKTNVLFTPENNNHEIALARLILKNKKFFQLSINKNKNVPLNEGETEGVSKKVAIFEMGAYCRGEIRTMCEYVQPHISILTAIGQQHLDLFGSQKNIQLGKFEIAEAATDKVFFNADNTFCQEIFKDKKITASSVGISTKKTQTKASPDKTQFHAFGEDFVLPWPGEFFVSNALLALECARELGAKPKNLAKTLKQLPPLERAMKFETHPQGFTIIKDLYSSNPTGVLSAIDHLKKFSGKKIFIGIPLLELGKEVEKIHTQIFHKIANIKADVFWIKDDHQKLGQDICTKNWHGNDPKKLKEMMKILGQNDVILFEGRLPKEMLATVSKKNRQ